jgi:tetratricopeptide (TPR) repeat protein
LATSVAGVIEPALQAAETARSAGRPTNDLTAYDLYLRAYALYLSSARQIPKALRLLEQAIARDPRYGLALAWAAVCCTRLLLDDQSEDREVDALKGADFARRALEVAGDDPGVLANVAYALACLGEDIGAMMALVDRALALNPSFARGWHISGTLRLFAGQSDTAIEHNEAALRLSPRARVGASLLVIGSAHCGPAPRLARTPGKPNDLTLRGLFTSAVVRPCLSQLPPLPEEVATPIGGFDFVAHGVRECQLPNLAREVRPLGSPIRECRAEAVHREPVLAHAAQEHVHRHGCSRRFSGRVDD